jgi:hypothetical protein
MLRTLFSLLGALVALAPAPALATTLGDLLAEVEVPLEAFPSQMLALEVTSYASLDDERAFVLAGYLGDGASLAERPTLWHYDRVRERWQLLELPLTTIAGDDLSVCAGSVLAVTRYGERLFLRTHLSPSATCELILDDELRLEDALFGWVVAGLPNGSVIYQHSQVHFAPVRPLELSRFDPASGRHGALYPPLPPYGELRDHHLRERTGALASLGSDWCNRNNHPCTPLPFDASLRGAVAVTESGDALAFIVELDRGLVDPDAEPLRLVHILYPLDNRGLTDHRELALDDVPLRDGEPDLTALLTPDTLRELFAPERLPLRR